MLWGLVAGTLGLSGVGALWWRLWRAPLPKQDGTLRVSGLRKPVTISRDRWGVPHVVAEDLHDVLYGLGYCHAQDRLWQLELQRRIGSGRLSEFMGEKAVGADRFLRRLGLRRAAQAEWTSQTHQEKRLLEAYCRGVNAAAEAAAKRMPLEFRILGIPFEPYTPVDALTYPKLMAFSLGTNWEAELLRGRLLERHGPEVAAKMEPFYMKGQPFIVDNDMPASGELAAELEALFKEAAPFLPHGTLGSASNNWVVSGARTASGKPMLANDPHLALQVPGVWYEVELEAPDLHVTGASIPGVVGILIGHNERVAWGITNSGADCMDLFVERFRGQRYEQEGEWREATVVEEIIRIKGKDPVTEKVYITRNGPVLSGGPPAGKPHGLVLKWTAHVPGSPVAGVIAMGQARNVFEFQEALRLWTGPSVNVGFADVDGNIGYLMTGPIPKRRKGSGLTPVPGWSGAYDWDGWIPFEELPQAINPPCGYIVTANNAVVDRTYPHHISWDYMNGFRAARITQMLQSKERFTAADFEAMQQDVLNLAGLQFIQHCASLRAKGAVEEQALRALQQWDGYSTQESVGATVYEATLQFTLRRYLEARIGDLADDYLGRPPHDLWPVNLVVTKGLAALLRDLAEGENLSREMQGGFEEAVRWLRKRLGARVERWHWGRLHRIHLKHAMADVPLVGQLFKPKSAPLSGGMETVLQASYVPFKPFDAAAWVPSYRMVVDLADLGDGRAVLPSGQSGIPASPHYLDQFPLWHGGKYHPQLFGQEAVEREVESVLTLEPVTLRRS